MCETTVKMCIDKLLLDEEAIQAAEIAIQENPLNRVAPSALASAGPSGAELGVFASKKWQTGRTLRVLFLEGHAIVQDKVREQAQKWSRYANIDFEFVAHGAAEIRIAFQPGGSWSYIGTDALLPQIGLDEPTMNFGWLTPHSAEDEYSRVVVHEFGHALGCIHEHQNPSGGIPWDREAVYNYYMGPPNNWSRQQVDINLLQTYSQQQTQFTALDTSSIMMYPIDQSLTTGNYAVGLNRELSAMDKQFIALVYPGREPEAATKIR